MILKMEVPDIGFQFVWNPEARALYSLHPNDTQHEHIAANIETPEQAQFAAMMWARGYRSRAREAVKKPGSKHYQILAESGQVGARFG